MILLPLFYFLALVQAALSLQSFLSGLRYLRFFREELRKEPVGPFPYATLIVPFKGLDLGLEENIRAFLSQDYPGFEAIFVVEDENDPAVNVIEKAVDGTDLPVRVVVAGKAVNTGQKTHNLLAAVREASETSQVFVFADSDARPSGSWMRALVSAALSEEKGCASG
jgi:cellulose synthase/poly-beta-1,6-N-acetylglucosamine synthase-like glycosyltransferase